MVLVIYVCFQMYFPMDCYCKTQPELTKMFKSCRNFLRFHLMTSSKREVVIYLEDFLFGLSKMPWLLIFANCSLYLKLSHWFNKIRCLLILTLPKIISARCDVCWFSPFCWLLLLSLRGHLYLKVSCWRNCCRRKAQMWVFYFKSVEWGSFWECYD